MAVLLGGDLTVQDEAEGEKESEESGWAQAEREGGLFGEGVG